MEGTPPRSRPAWSLAVEELAVFLSSRQQELRADLGSSFLLNRHTEPMKIPADILPFSPDNDEKSHLQHAVTLPFKQPTVAGTTRGCRHVTLKSDCYFILLLLFLPAVLIGQPVQRDCSLSTGTFKEPLDGIVPA